jgi:NAD-dependent DNA ligase
MKDPAETCDGKGIYFKSRGKMNRDSQQYYSGQICPVCQTKVSYDNEVDGVLCDIHQECFNTRVKKFELWYLQELKDREFDRILKERYDLSTT